MFRLTRKSIAVVLALGVSGIVIGVLVKQLLYEISELTTARVDSSQWTLSQLEVELLKFRLSLAEADTTADVEHVRTRFDLFYSRVSTVSGGYARRFLSEDKEAVGHLERTQEFLETAVPLIDSADTELLAAVPLLSEQLDAIQPDVRGLSLRGVAVFGERNDTRRESLLVLLQRIAAMTAALCAALVFLLFRLQRALQASEHRGLELRQTSERLATTIASSLDAVLVMEADGTILEFNGAAEEIFKIARNDAVGRLMHDLIIPPEHRKAHLAGVERFLNTGVKHMIGAGRIQLTALRGDGARFPIEFSVSKASHQRGPIFISFIRDISEQLAAQNELLEARDNALAAENEKSRFIAVMSHEMRTPLNGIMGTLDLLQHGELDQKQRSLLTTARNSSEILLDHVNDVLDISRLEAEAIDMAQETVVPAELIEEVGAVMENLAREKGNRITLDIQGESRQSMLGDAARIRQVLTNLTSNAINATRNGQITLQVSSERQDQETNRITFRVMDQGVGIAEADLERVFGDFVTLDSDYSRENEGTGLGLSISRRLVRLMGGSMGVESTPNRGSIFSFSIPMQPAPDAHPKEEQTTPPVQPQTSRRVLLVEDNATNQLVASEMLRRLGHQVTIANNGIEGVEAAQDGTFDLVLMDISMPHMDGIAATRHIRELAGSHGSVPIIAMTAHALPSERQAFLAAGMNDCLVKPVRESSLQHLVENLTLFDTSELNGERIHEDTLLELIQVVGESKFIRLIDEFCAETAESLPLIEQHLGHEDYSELKKLAHRLAGSSATFGAQKLRGLFVSMESYASIQEGDRLGPLLRKTREEFELTRSELDEILESE